MNNSIDADVSYCIGLNIAENLKSQNLGNLDIENFLAGVQVLLKNEQPKFSVEQVHNILNAYFELKK